MNKVLFDIKNKIATVTLNRPDVSNSFDDKVISQLLTIWQNINENPDILVVVLKGSGANFCAGADLNWMRNMINNTEQENKDDAMQLARVMRELNNLSKPTIAVVQGAVYGGGVGLVACCDIAIAEPNTKFCFSEVKLGLAPAVISPYIINAIGARQAKRYMLTAEVISAEQAKKLNLIHDIMPGANLDDLIKLLIRSGPKAIACTKKLINELPANNTAEYTAEIIAKLRVGSEAQILMKDFLCLKKS